MPTADGGGTTTDGGVPSMDGSAPTGDGAVTHPCDFVGREVKFVLDGTTHLTMRISGCGSEPIDDFGCGIHWFDFDRAIATGPLTGSFTSMGGDGSMGWFHWTAPADMSFNPVCQFTLDALLRLSFTQYDLTSGMTTEAIDFVGSNQVGSGLWSRSADDLTGTFVMFDGP